MNPWQPPLQLLKSSRQRKQIKLLLNGNCVRHQMCYEPFGFVKNNQQVKDRDGREEKQQRQRIFGIAFAQHHLLSQN